MSNKTIYAAKLRAIRPYTRGFGASDGYDLTKFKQWSSARKAQVNRYYELISKATSISHYVFRPRKKANLAAALEQTGMKSYRKLKVAILRAPVVVTKKGKIKVATPKISISKAGEMSVETDGVTREPLTFEKFGFSPEEVAIDPEAAVRRILDETDYSLYTIMAGEFEVGKGLPEYRNKQGILEKYLFLIEKYGEKNQDPYDTNSSYYGNWLFGLVGYNFNRSAEFADYAEAQAKYNQHRERINEQIKPMRNKIYRLKNEIKKLKKQRRLPWREKEKQIRKREDKIESLTVEIINLRKRRRTMPTE